MERLPRFRPGGTWPAVLFLSAYPLVQLVIRLALGDGLEKDEAEQVVLTQSLGLGYPGTSGQPPLYTWLQLLFFAAFGINAFSLAALRALLQILAQLALYRSADLVLGNRTLAALAALSLWLVPQFSVESLRKTHSVLATCLAAAFLHALLLVWQSGRTGAYVWLGATLGLGALAKYNFAIFAVGLLLAGVSVGPLRRALLDRRLALVFGVAAGLAAPHVVWLLSHLPAVAADISPRIEPSAAGPWTIANGGGGLRSLGAAVLGYLPPVALHLARIMRERTRWWPNRATLGSREHFVALPYVGGATIRAVDDFGARERGQRPGRGLLAHRRLPWSGAENDGGRAQGVAPRARAICHHSGCHGNAVGKCSTMRRTDRVTHTATLSSRARNVGACAVAHAVLAAWSRSACTRM